VMEAMFGDHVRVIATRDGFDVNDYDHDWFSRSCRRIP
jgi:hypothetical protein